MRALRLDYRSRAGRATWLRVALFACGFIAAGLVTQRAQEIDAELQGLQAEISRLEQRAEPKPKALSRQEREAVERTSAALQAVGRRLARPWDDLFAALENAQTSGIALLSIDPDADKTVLITAEARDLSQMLRYAKRLRSASAFNEAHVTKHEILDGPDGQRVLFSLTAHMRKPS